jgi:hypothetical protein
MQPDRTPRRYRWSGRQDSNLRARGPKPRGNGQLPYIPIVLMAPPTGLEPATCRLKAGCSSIELQRERWVVDPCGFEPQPDSLQGSRTASCATGPRMTDRMMAGRGRLERPAHPTACASFRARSVHQFRHLPVARPPGFEPGFRRSTRRVLPDRRGASGASGRNRTVVTAIPARRTARCATDARMARPPGFEPGFQP